MNAEILLEQQSNDTKDLEISPLMVPAVSPSDGLEDFEFFPPSLACDVQFSGLCVSAYTKDITKGSSIIIYDLSIKFHTFNTNLNNR